MNRVPAFLLIAALSLPGIRSVQAEPSRPSGNLTLAQAERNSIELKQGMSAEEVQKLLGKPRRTGLKNNGIAANSPGSLQWTYSWSGSTSPAGSLRVDFSAKTAQDWYVTSWEWATY